MIELLKSICIKGTRTENKPAKNIQHVSSYLIYSVDILLWKNATHIVQSNVAEYHTFFSKERETIT